MDSRNASIPHGVGPLAIAFLGLTLGTGACGGSLPPVTHADVVDGLLAEGLTGAEHTVTELEGRIRLQGRSAARTDINRWFCGSTADTTGRQRACRYFRWLGRHQPAAQPAHQPSGREPRPPAGPTEQQVADALLQDGFGESIEHLHRCRQYFVDDALQDFTQCSELYFCSMRGATRGLTLGCDFLRSFASTYVPDPHELNAAERGLLTDLARSGTPACRAWYADDPTAQVVGDEAVQCADAFATAVRAPRSPQSTTTDRQWARVLHYVLQFSALARASDDAWIAIAGASAVRMPETMLDSLVHTRADRWRQQGDVRHISICVDLCGASISERATLNSWGAARGTLQILHGVLSALADIAPGRDGPSQRQVLDGLGILDRARTYLDAHREQLGLDYVQADQVLLDADERTRRRLFDAYSMHALNSARARVEVVNQMNVLELPTDDLVRVRQTMSETTRIIDAELESMLPVFGSRAASWEQDMRAVRDTCETHVGSILAELDARERLSSAVAEYCSTEARIAALRDFERRQQEINRHTRTRDIEQERRLAAAMIATEERRDALLAAIRADQPDYRVAGACASRE